MEDSLLSLKSQLLEIAHLKSTLAILSWDEEVYMPAKSFKVRAETKSYLAGLLHQKFTSKEFEKTLKDVKKFADAGSLNDQDAVIFRETYRDFHRQKKLPLEYVKELTEVTSTAYHKWAEARQKSDFKSYAPWLKKIVQLKRQEAEYLGYKDSPYDALLDEFEPGLTSADLDLIFEPLKEFLIPFIKKIRKSKVKNGDKKIQGKFDLEKQKQLTRLISEKIGFDYQRGRIDISHHPFTTSFHPDDARITTRYDSKNIMYAIGSTVHEVGHALYELGLPAEHFGTPLAESVSLGIHESQSRIWENQVGKSKSFWRYFYPQLKKVFPSPFKIISLNDFYKAINTVQPSLIRTESDEVTYNLHIIIRYELEKALIEGKITVEQLPELWRQKVQSYLGIKVPSDAVGVLQDVHWSGGMIGYFPTYSLGNLYSAQIYATALKKIKNLEQKFEQGNFKDFREWLRKNIHIYGRIYPASELILRVTGKSLDSKYFIDYISKKYSQIYKIK